MNKTKRNYIFSMVRDEHELNVKDAINNIMWRDNLYYTTNETLAVAKHKYLIQFSIALNKLRTNLVREETGGFFSWTLHLQCGRRGGEGVPNMQHTNNRPTCAVYFLSFTTVVWQLLLYFILSTDTHTEDTGHRPLI